MVWNNVTSEAKVDDQRNTNNLKPLKNETICLNNDEGNK
jgi:hypothetical protein